MFIGWVGCGEFRSSNGIKFRYMGLREVVFMDSLFTWLNLIDFMKLVILRDKKKCLKVSRLTVSE